MHVPDAVREVLPAQRLPVKLEILKHYAERSGKSTALHAKLVCPEDVTVHTYDRGKRLELGDEERVLLLFPGPVGVGGVFVPGFCRNRFAAHLYLISLTLTLVRRTPNPSPPSHPPPTTASLYSMAAGAKHAAWSRNNPGSRDYGKSRWRRRGGLCSGGIRMGIRRMIHVSTALR